LDGASTDLDPVISTFNLIFAIIFGIEMGLKIIGLGVAGIYSISLEDL